MLKMPPGKGGITVAYTFDLFAFLVFASLICNSAAGFASRLAGSLAFAAAAVLGALAKVLGLQGLNVVHHGTSVQWKYFDELILPDTKGKVNPFHKPGKINAGKFYMNIIEIIVNIW